MLSHHPAKFGGHRHCGCGDMNIPTNSVMLPQMRDIRDDICPLTSALSFSLKRKSSHVFFLFFFSIRVFFHGH